jgi:hypothetical protein
MGFRIEVERVPRLRPGESWRKGVVTSLWPCGPTGEPVVQRDEKNQLRRVPVPARGHSAVDLALTSIHIEFPRRRRFVSGTRHRGFIRDGPALGEPLWADDRGELALGRAARGRDSEQNGHQISSNR